jgi:hypothetical protein
MPGARSPGRTPFARDATWDRSAGARGRLLPDRRGTLELRDEPTDGRQRRRTVRRGSSYDHRSLPDRHASHSVPHEKSSRSESSAGPRGQSVELHFGQPPMGLVPERTRGTGIRGVRSDSADEERHTPGASVVEGAVGFLD